MKMHILAVQESALDLAVQELAAVKHWQCTAIIELRHGLI